MHSQAQSHRSIFGMNWNQTNPALAMMLTLLFLIFAILLLTLTAQPAQGQTYQVIYNFTGGADGGTPAAGVRLDSAGNLYGTNLKGNGTVFRLLHSGSGWAFKNLYTFQGGNDGQWPYAGVTIAGDGSVYGSTLGGGGGGTVFRLRPSARACMTALCPWVETVLHRFSGGADGWAPYAGVVFDQAGNLYGTTNVGGGTGCSGHGCGTVYELTPSIGGWTETIIHTFSGPDGASPSRDNSLIFDQAGNLYGPTFSGGAYDCGTVFQLSPSGSGWTEKVLYSFQGSSDGCNPDGGVIFDQAGNLYGSTGSGSGGGTVFQLSPSGENWTFNSLYTFAGYSGPAASLTMDAAGNLYGTTTNGGISCSYGGNGCGMVFKLTPSPGGWMFTSLHDFTRSDGAFPYSTVAFDAAGNMYGTAAYGGAHDNGVVWQITP